VPFARIKLTFDPGEPGAGFILESSIGRTVPRNSYPWRGPKGLTSSKENGRCRFSRDRLPGDSL